MKSTWPGQMLILRFTSSPKYTPVRTIGAGEHHLKAGAD
jgi:hypothetical protein